MSYKFSVQKILDTPWQTAIASFVSGALLVFSLPPFGFWPALFLGFGLFYFIFEQITSAKIALLQGWLFGFGYFVFGLYWIGNALLVDGNEYAWAWPLAVAGLPALLAFFPGIACYITCKYCNPHSVSRFLAFTAAMALSEWLRGHIFTGFPWNLYGYGWHSISPIIQIVALGGSYLLTLLTIFWGTTAGLVLSNRTKHKTKVLIALITLTSLVLCFIYGVERLQIKTGVSPQTIVKIVQPSIPQKDKWNPDKMYENFLIHLQLSAANPENADKTTFIIWPETALSDFLMRHKIARHDLKNTLQYYNKDVFLLTGYLQFTHNQNGEEEYRNSLIIFDKQGNHLASYDKSHLVPFGEYIPFQKWIPLTPVANFSGFQAGNKTENIVVDNFNITPLICYEIIFPHRMIQSANKSNLIVNVTNDAWYGKSAGPYQHFSQARFRAIEQGTPVVRSANTGISGLIDPFGRIITEQKMYFSASQDELIPLSPSKATTYTIAGDKIFAGFIVILIIIIVIFQGHFGITNKN